MLHLLEDEGVKPFTYVFTIKKEEFRLIFYWFIKTKEEEIRDITKKFTSSKTPELADGRIDEDDFANFDLGLESLLRAPLDIINQQIDDIHILDSSR